MPIPLLVGAGIAQGIGGLVKSLWGRGQTKQANKILKEIGESPNESIPTEILQNQRLATERANQGLPSEMYSQAMRNLQRQQLLQMRNAHTRRGGLGIVAGGQADYNNGLLNLDVANANAKMQNERTLYGINNNVGNWRDKVWRNNVKDVWDRKYNYAMSLKGMGNQNKAGGIDQILGGIGTAFGGIGGGGSSLNPYQKIYSNNAPRAGLNYIPLDEQLPE